MRFSILFIVSILTYLLSITPLLAQDINKSLGEEYYNTGEYEKALDAFDKYLKGAGRASIFLVHDKIMDSYLKLNRLSDAEKYLKKTLKTYEKNPHLSVDYYQLLIQMGNPKGAKSFLDEFLKSIEGDDALISTTARNFINNGLYDNAETLLAPLVQKSPRMYGYDMANVYALSGKTDQMVEVYLKMLKTDPSQLKFVESILQSRISDEDSWKKIEPILFKYAQAEPDDVVYGELIVWYYLQRKDFLNAFTHARAVDRRKKMQGFQILEIGELALNNKAYKEAVEIFTYIVDKYPRTEIYDQARYMMIYSREKRIENTFPILDEDVKTLINEYKKSIEISGLNHITVKSIHSRAKLEAYHLNQLDTAIALLESIVNQKGLNRTFIAEAKLDLGDFYLIKGEWWEATLRYSQVEKEMKESDFGHKAKLRNARLSFYRGDFELAKAHLDILKLATSRVISNDAMDLSLLIQDNLGLDTTTTTLLAYAEADLLTFQGRYEEAQKALNDLKKKNAGHAIIDEVLLLQSKNYIKTGKYKEATLTLDEILKDYKEDLYGDDAMFLLGELYEVHLKDIPKAMEYYRQVLTDFPGSIFAAEARKRFRILRGDSNL